MKTQSLGQAAEDLAANHLQKQGFTIVARNYRYQRAEVDIIVQKQKLLVFTEVKARSNDQFGHPEDFVTPQQQTLIHAAAEDYILAQQWDEAIRFDIIAVFKRNGQMQLTHFEDAF
ncbi:MAG: YraN family protein [Bacteroidota bacterium]